MPSLPTFDTTCFNGLSTYKSFTLTGTGLNNTNIVVGPVAGFKFSSTATGTYNDSLIIAAGYGTTLTQSVFVKFSPAAAGTYNANASISGGGAAPASITLKGIAVNSSPVLSAIVTNISCKGSKNGAIDLTLTGGTGPFTYTWTGTGTFNHAIQDINGLSPVNYAVTVGSYAGCSASANYTVTEPDALAAVLTYDSMICKNGTTNVYLSGTGGTLPYSGIGTFVKSSGSSSFTITDAKGCSATKSISVANGSGIAPVKPVTINSPGADATGLCGGGNFVFSIDTVATATSYTWTKPAGSTITTNATGTQATLGIPTNFVKDSVSVKANNVCGSSVATVKQLTNLPGKPGTISGPVSVAPSQTGIVYSIIATAGLTYTWTVPGAASITSGQNTAAIVVNWGVTSGNVTVKANNNCGVSATNTLSVSTVNSMFVATPSSLSFDTLCVNGLSTSKSFKLSASGLTGSAVTVGPLTGYVFSLTNAGTYTNSVSITGYGTSINQSVYVKFNPLTVGGFNGNIPVTGGGAAAASVAVTARSVNSSPAPSVLITKVTCNGLKNGAIDLSVAGGTGPFTYTWTGTGTFDHAQQDISGLGANSYTVSIGSYAGCTSSATYTVTQPDVLTPSLSADNMICKNGTTNVFVSATGGTLPYTGTGTFVRSSGANSFTVTDVNGCSGTKSITVANGSGVAPAKPVVINGSSADATGLCGGGNFTFSIDSVQTATSYTWAAPSGSTIASTSNGGKQAVLSAPAGFSTGTLSVTANNTCGSSAATTKSLTSIPGKPGAITGPISVTSKQTDLVYSVSPVIPGITYTWTVPGTGSITSGQNTSSIVVKWGTISGNVNVKANNNCGVSASTTLAVTVASSIASQQNTESISTASASNLSIMPNPAKDVAYFTFNADENYKYTVIITDLSGKLLQRNENIAAKGTNRIKLDVHNYTNGLYLVTLVNDKGERSTLKLVKE